jgi:hypothetical protein
LLCLSPAIVLLRRCSPYSQAKPRGPPSQANKHPTLVARRASIHSSIEADGPSGTWCPVLWLHTSCCRPRVVSRRRRRRRRRPDDNAPALHPLPRAQSLLIPSNRSRPRPPCMSPRPPPPAAAAAPTRWSPQTAPGVPLSRATTLLCTPFAGGGPPVFLLRLPAR